MKAITKKLNQKTLVSWLIQPIGIILLASLAHFGSCQAQEQAPRLILEITSDISKLPDETVQVSLANISETAIDPTECQLWAVQNFTYQRGTKKLNRKLHKIIPLKKLTGSEELSVDGDRTEISFDLREHPDTTDAGLVAYSVECFIVKGSNVISDQETLRWNLEESRAEKHVSTFLSQSQLQFMYALINSFVDKAVYPFCRDNIFDPIKNYLFKKKDNSSTDLSSSGG